MWDVGFGEWAVPRVSKIPKTGGTCTNPLGSYPFCKGTCTLGKRFAGGWSGVTGSRFRQDIAFPVWCSLCSVFFGETNNIGALRITNTSLGAPDYRYRMMYPQTRFQLLRPLY